MIFARRLASVITLAVLAVTIPAAPAQRYTFRQYGSADGLSNLSINCLIQDQTGYIWAGTDNGLFRYDGDRFQAFGHMQGLPNSEILSMAESPEGVLWVATQGGLAWRNGNAFKFVQGTEEKTFQTVSFDRDGNIYLSHPEGIIEGVADGTGWYRFRTVVQGAVSALFVNGMDAWFAEDGELWHMVGGKRERAGSVAGLPEDRWEAIAQDSAGNLWVRSATQLFELPHDQGRFENRSKGIPHASRTRLYTDRHGRLYVSSNSGLVVLDGGARTFIDPAHGLPADSTSSFLLDREESLWLGMYGGGLVRRLGHGEWLAWTHRDGLVHDGVWSTLHDSQGRLWVGTIGGLTLFAADGHPVHSWTGRSGLPGDWVHAITEAPDGEVYVGTSPGGLARFSRDGALLRTYGTASGLKADRVNAALLDHENRYWVLAPNQGCFRTRAPLSAIDGVSFEPVNIPGLAEGTIYRSLAVDGDGRVWISTSKGLIRYDHGRVRVLTEADGLKSSAVSSMAPGKDDFWVGYRDALGITRLSFDGEKISATHFTQQNGLSSDLVYALALDRTGRLWASSDNGVEVLAGAESPGLKMQERPGTAEEPRWLHYTREDGLIWDDGNDLTLSVDGQNNVWIGTSGGLSRFAPLRYSLPRGGAPIVLTSIEGADYKGFAPGDTPALPHAQDSLLIRFSSLNYANESNPHFRYRLLGYKTEWNETRERSVHFEGLPSGRYTFEVAAEGPGGQWSPEPARFSFAVKAAWWESWWFLTLCLLIMGALATVVWRYRVRALVAQKERLAERVAEQTAALIESHRQLEQLAYCDVLTGLPNRRMFTEQFRQRMAQARRHAKPFALLLIDLDYFKTINDTYGHDAGDAVLLETAVRLRLAVRESDCVARLGGDEFAILLMTAPDQAAIEAVCCRIITSLAAGMPFNGADLVTSCSIGIALFPEDGETQEGLYKAADLALYQAKRGSRNSYRWHEGPDIVRLRVEAEDRTVTLR
jgi:diguanylate cyclase (GGDEF)-like protein